MTQFWKPTHKGDVRCRKLADLHYTRQTPGHPMWTRPGYNYVLYFANEHGEAAWCWWRPKWEHGTPGTQRKDGLQCLECTLFANKRWSEEAVLSSALVQDAVSALWLPKARRDLHLQNPHKLLLITGVDSKQTAKRRARASLPGKCYREAGWSDFTHRKGKADTWLSYTRSYMNDAELLQECLAVAANSDCAKLRFGAVACDETGAIIGDGWNHNPKPFDTYACARDCVGKLREGVRSGTCVERCYAIHAEQHALLRAGGAAYEIVVAGLRPDDSLFDNGGGFYCTVCARLMASAGVKYVSIWNAGVRTRITIEQAWEQSYSIATRPA